MYCNGTSAVDLIFDIFVKCNWVDTRWQ